MYESEKSRSAKNQGAQKRVQKIKEREKRAQKIKERESTSTKAQKLRPKKEHKNVSAKSFA
jgi:hypothetical protein